MSPRPALARSLARDETGGVLVSVLVVAALAVLVLGSLARTMVEAEVEGRAIASSEAFYHAEAGLQHALAVLIESDRGFADDLLGPDGREGTDDDGWLLGKTPVAFADGAYLVRLVNNWSPACAGKEDADSDSQNDGLCDDGSGDGDGDSNDDGYPDATDSDGVAVLWALGISGDSRAAIRATVDVRAGDVLGAGIYTDGVISSGNGAEVRASEAVVHGNGGLRLARNSDIYGAPGTSATAQLSPGTKIDGRSLSSAETRDYEAAHSGLKPIEIPEIVPADYLHLADYRFAADGTVYDRSGNPVAKGTFNSWEFSNKGWRLNNVDGAYQPMVGYFETDVSVSAQDEIVTTIITEGSASMNGGSIRAAVDDLLLVAGGDASIGGNANATAYVGNVYIREQIETFGTSGLMGNIVAQDAAQDHRLVRGDAIQLGSDIIVDPSLRNTLGSEGAGLTDWYLDLRGDHREIFR